VRAEPVARPFVQLKERGLLGRTEPSLMHGGRTMGKHSEVFVAFDVAKKKHAVAIAEGGRVGEVRFLGEVENSPLPIDRMIRRLAARYGRLHVCFEAGPTGYGLYRQVQALGHDGMVVAPALIPKRAGERIRRTAGTRLRWHVFIGRVSLRECGRPTRLMRLSGILRGLARRRLTTFGESASSFCLFFSGIAGFTAAAATGRWRIGAGSPARRSTMPPSRSSFRKGSTQLKILFSACAASRSNSLSSRRSGPWRRWWQLIRPCAALRFSSP
jgi:hypothetical protein